MQVSRNALSRKRFNAGDDLIKVITETADLDHVLRCLEALLLEPREPEAAAVLVLVSSLYDLARTHTYLPRRSIMEAVEAASAAANPRPAPRAVEPATPEQLELLRALNVPDHPANKWEASNWIQSAREVRAVQKERSKRLRRL